MYPLATLASFDGEDPVPDQNARQTMVGECGRGPGRLKIINIARMQIPASGMLVLM